MKKRQWLQPLATDEAPTCLTAKRKDMLGLSVGNDQGDSGVMKQLPVVNSFDVIFTMLIYLLVQMLPYF